MKKIIVGLVFLFGVASFIYAFLENAALTKARTEAELNATAAMEARMLADQNAFLAKREAERADQLSDSLKKCKGR
ncbi:MAG TPA: hypothetical protein VG737_00590 [Cyclobacteriaceae bacterium]|nr:hypothetical protein [Cyclobacteriaceae bacterium]